MSEQLFDETDLPAANTEVDKTPEEKVAQFQEDFQSDIKKLAEHYGATIIVAAQFESPRGITINYGSKEEQANEMVLLGLATKLHTYISSQA